MDSKITSSGGVLSNWRYQRIGDDSVSNWRKPISSSRKFRRVVKLRKDPNAIENKAKKSKKWRFRLPKKIKLRAISPKSLLQKLRDAYMNFMISFTAKRSNAGLIGFGHEQSSANGLGLSNNDAMSNKDLQRLYTAYLQRAVAEGRLTLADDHER